jgi:hypothetical protein
MIMFSRKAAELVLQNYRTVFTTENRTLFSQLSGIDIGKYWAFRGEQHWLVADWNFDRVLAAHGLASLALTPNRVTMLDQDIGPLGLKYADGNAEGPIFTPGGGIRANASQFELYRDNLARIRAGGLKPGIHHPFYRDENGFTIFPHQVPQIGGIYVGNWRVRDFLGFGPFCWRAGRSVLEDEACGTQTFSSDSNPTLTVPILGLCDFLVSGGEKGGNIQIEDEQSGYKADPYLPAENGSNYLQLSVPGSANYRNIKLTALSPGVCFLGIKTGEPQPWLSKVRFDYATLPPP